MPVATGVCERCGEIFRKEYSSKRFCGRRCWLAILNAQREHQQNAAQASREYSRNPDAKYVKIHGRHEHRVVAAEMLGRPLEPGEVVHHIDGNGRNNDPSNLQVFKSQSEHAAHHAKGGHGFK